jgi:hypothetical protein
VGSEEDALLSSEEEKNMALVRRFLEAQANADLVHDQAAFSAMDRCS